MKIFRKIRLSSLTRGRFSKYILYATGEILLVVIGILIALYLNNEKDISNRQEKQKNHLVLIKEELENNLLILGEEDETLSEMIVNIRGLINLGVSDTLIKDINEVDLSELLFLPLTRSIEIDYENGAFNEFVASNSLKDIENDSLRSLLRSWDRKLETLKFQENVVRQSLDKSNNFMEIHGSLKTIFDNRTLSEDLEINNSPTSLSNKHILKSKQFENILLQYLGVATQLHASNYPDFESDVNVLIRLIEGEIVE